MTEVAKATVLLQEGEWIYCHFPASSRGFRRAEARRPSRPLGTGLLPQVPGPRQEGFAESHSRFGVPPEWGLLLLPPGELRQEENRAVRAGFLSTEGALLLPLHPAPVNPSGRPRNSAFPAAFRCFRGAASTPSVAGPSTGFRKRVAAFFRAFVGGARDLLPRPRAVKRLDACAGDAAQVSQGRASRFPRRSRSAMAAASRSVLPARRARSWATSASSCSPACSSVSFTST